MATQFCVQLPVSTIGDVVNDVAKVIASTTHEYIKFPDLDEQNLIAAHFAEEFGFPGCVGVAGMSLL